MGMSLKQIRYLYAIGVFKRDGSKDRLKKSTPLTGLTKRQATVRLGKIGSSLSTGEVSTTHRLRIGDTTYPIQKDRNGSSYPAVKGRTKSLSELPEGPMSIERIDIKAKKGQKRVAKVDALPDLTQTTYAKASKAFDDEWAKTVRDDKGFTDPVRQIEGLGKVRDYVHGQYVLNDDYDNLLTKDQLIEKLHPGAKGEHRAAQDIVPDDYTTDHPIKLREKIRLRNSPMVSRQRQDDHPKVYTQELEEFLYNSDYQPDTEWMTFRHAGEQAGKKIEEIRVQYSMYESMKRKELRQDGVFTEVTKAIPRLQKEFEEQLKELAPQSRTTQNALSKILDEGFKSQVTTKTTMAANKDVEMRKRVDRELFGFSGTEDKRPIYGYMGDRDGSSFAQGTAQYGEAVVVFKPSVRDRTTVTWGDSLDNNTASYGNARDVPTPLSQPQLTSLDPVATGLLFKHPGRKLTELSTGYIEAQLHGGLSASDIDIVHFRSDSPPKPAVVKKLKLLGIPYTVAKSDDREGYYPKARGK